MRYFCIIFFLFNYSLWSQCQGVSLIKVGGDFKNVDYIAHCPTYNFKYNAEDSSNWISENYTSDNSIDLKAELSSIKENLETKLKEYTGTELFSKLKLQSVSVSVYDSISKMTSRYPVVDMSKCKTKYFFFYHLLPSENAQFCIGIALDDYLNIISDLPFPTKDEHKILDPSLNACRAFEIAKTIGIPITPIESVFFDYNYDRKEFFWIVRQKIENVKKGVNEYNEVTIEASDSNQVTSYRKTILIE